jgi:RNA ligase
MDNTNPTLPEGVLTILEAVRQHKDNLEAYRDLGDIKVIQQDELLLFNYTKECQLAKRWNAVERVSRGLVIHWPTATVAALPFEKFFNLDEREETQLATLPLDERVEITAKLDGSLGIVFFNPDKETWRVVTRGSFTSEQALWATEFLNREYPKLQEEFSEEGNAITLLVEIIYPENRVVVNYGEERQLYLLGVRGNNSGNDWSYDAVKMLARYIGMPVAPRVKAKSINDLLPLVKTARNIEGWVIRFTKSNLRVKLKTEEYLKLHRLVTNLSPIRVRDLMLQGPDKFREFLVEIPEEFQKEVEDIKWWIDIDVASEKIKFRNQLWQVFSQVARQHRKDFALAVKEQFPETASWLFALLDDKDIYPDLVKKIDLKKLFRDDGQPIREVEHEREEC